jgi:predicted nucleotidyltransferase component of viral defense system
LSGSPTLEELVDVQQFFKLQAPSLVEKDWFVVRALAAIIAADSGPFQLVFQGGTALARAHRITQRMSEDIDLKIVSTEKQSRGTYRRLRESVTAALLAAGFEFDPAKTEHRKTMWEAEYVLYRLPYKSVTAPNAELRPSIKIEVSAWPQRRDPVQRAVASFVTEAFKRPPEIPAIATSDLAENAAEKFVALTRRAGAQLAGLREKRDPTLVRHIYDLHLLEKHLDPADVASLIAVIMQDDAETRGNLFPAYQQDARRETLRAVEGILADPQFAAEYASFVRSMVYGEGPGFDTAIGILKVLAEELKKAQT